MVINTLFLFLIILHIADYYGGLRIIDVSNPQNPALFGYYGINSARYVTVSNNIAL